MPSVTTTPSDSPEARIAALEAALVAMTAERDKLRASHERLRMELELLRRRIFVASAERVDTAQLEMEFAAKLAELDKLGGALPRDDGDDEDRKKKKKKTPPTGRRDLSKLPLEEVRVEITDPLFEELVASGKAERIGHEESAKLAHKRGGLRRLVIARVKYRATDARGESRLETAPMPPECFPRSMAAPSLLAKILTDKYCDGLPLNRIEDRFARDGARIDRGTMSRWVEDAGATAGATVIAAARREAISTAFCIATDATGVAVQPIRSHEKSRQACRRGHYFVLIADRDHVFFEYTPKETSRVIAEMFRGYQGYVQADAKSVYDVLFREPEDDPPDDPGAMSEVGCWSHCRRKFLGGGGGQECRCARRTRPRRAHLRARRELSRKAASGDPSPAASAPSPSPRSVLRVGRRRVRARERPARPPPLRPRLRRETTRRTHARPRRRTSRPGK